MITKVVKSAAIAGGIATYVCVPESRELLRELVRTAVEFDKNKSQWNKKKVKLYKYSEILNRYLQK